MPTFVKAGYWKKAADSFKGWLNLDDLIRSDVPANETDPIVGAIVGIPTSDGAGNISQASEEVYKIKVLTTAQYAALNPKVDTTLYIIVDPTTTTTTTSIPTTTTTTTSV